MTTHAAAQERPPSQGLAKEDPDAEEAPEASGSGGWVMDSVILVSNTITIVIIIV